MPVTYALLKDPVEARRAIAELESMARAHPALHLRVHEHASTADELGLHETGALKGLSNGALCGAGGAVVLVTLLSVLGLIESAPLVATALAAVGLGAIYGGLVGFVAGCSGPDPNLARLEADMAPDDVIVTVACNRPHEFTEANAVLRRHGAIEAHPRLV